MENPKEKNKIAIAPEITGNEGVKNLNEITIIKNKNVFRDLRLFIEALDIKFKFKNKDKFVKDFIKLIHFDLAGNSTKDLDNVEEKFFNLIKKHSSDSDLKNNLKKAGDELQKFADGAVKWQKR